MAIQSYCVLIKAVGKVLIVPLACLRQDGHPMRLQTRLSSKMNFGQKWVHRAVGLFTSRLLKVHLRMMTSKWRRSYFGGGDIPVSWESTGTCRVPCNLEVETWSLEMLRGAVKS